MKTKFIASILIAQIFFCQLVFAQQRGVGVSVKNANGQTQQLYDGSYALIIGNSEYSNGWDRLSGVKADVVAVRGVLERHGFKVETEENLTSERFEARIRKFINDYGFDRDNRLIIYYAGHGYTLPSAGDKRELGYIIPADTPLPDKDARGFRQKAVDMYAIQTFAKQIQAKHALFVFDSCFSGKLFALRDTLKISPFILDKVDNPVRQFITAGNETQTVPDESIFRKAFVRGLEGDADRNNDTYITGTELADYLKESVTNYSNRRQIPQYGLINDIDLDRGDFVFAKPKGNGQSATTVVSNNSNNANTSDISDDSSVKEETFNFGSNKNFTIGSESREFITKWGSCSSDCVYAYADNLNSLANSKVKNFNEIGDFTKYDRSSRARLIGLKQILVLRNSDSYYALVQIAKISHKSKELTIRYKIIPEKRESSWKPNSANYISKASAGQVNFTFEDNNGEFIIGEGSRKFKLQFGGLSRKQVRIYNDGGIKLIRKEEQTKRYAKITADGRIAELSVGDLIVIENENKRQAVITIIDAESSGHSSEIDKVVFSYDIL